ncbi:5'-methylthioadenosine/adenosylhomocysteine nucleosidase [Paenibacillus sp. URB8-2]|uniref:5'-methylthioadenosine/adenosylhomocysteine nucleosidase n=1 Tax=Paenibacillus sp. URB8-2 TaxID=2741301 RepID=UPI0015BA19E7|nr:5'-methylthioadenosine/adenosylhomocysteine nucleosidase [Paenibacillus sp. URB8-2]BCG57884.1 5'-methylthioadenosine/S-adenosylhomocysteine nucleosidase [Paenibacillus sp. URB8-2]
MSIAIIGAMEEEVEVLRSRLENVRRTEAAGGSYYSGTLEGRDIVLLQSGIGKVNAALTTTLLIERYQPELIINTGAAGGIGSSLRIGDVVVGTELAYSDVDATAFLQYEYGQVPRMPARYPVPEEFLALARQLAAARKQDGRVLTGLITTADSFIGSKEAADFIRGRFPESLATDMEGAAIAQTAYRFGVPFLAVRAISDLAGSEAEGLFTSHLDLAAVNAAEFVLDWVKLYRPAFHAEI